MTEVNTWGDAQILLSMGLSYSWVPKLSSLDQHFFMLASLCGS